MKNVMNFKMLALFINKIALKHTLNSDLEYLFKDGFILQNECYFLKSLFNYQSHNNESDFLDKTGYECFINSLHIDDYVDIDLFEQAILSVNKMIELWKVQNNGLTLRVILSETDFGFNIKFHTIRESQKWIIEDDIDKFEEAVIIINYIPAPAGASAMSLS